MDWEVVAVGDFDGDGKSDVFWRNHSTGRNVVWLSGNAGTTQATTGVRSALWTVVGAGDFDGDGRDDVFWRNRGDGRNTIWLSADASTLQHTSRVSNLDWEVVEVGDFDGDGNDDAFWRNQVTGHNVAWLSGKGGTPQATVRVGDTRWTVVGAGDFDGDGRDDVFWRNRGDGRNTIWLSANAASLQRTYRVSNLAWTVMPYEGPEPVEPEPDPEPGPVLTVGDAQAFEGDSGSVQLHFTVSLSYPPTSPVTYSISTSDGTARAGSDYTASQLAGEVIPAGEDSRTFAVTVLGDTAIEGDETLNVNVSAVSGGGATVADARGRGTIRDDDDDYY